ncbi:MAG: BRCT domain-containing protein [Clostridia bacterium]|nr:BRCT domain-containing protein [Clostridia bacterium]
MVFFKCEAIRADKVDREQLRLEAETLPNELAELTFEGSPAPTEGNQNPFRDKTVAVSGTFERMDRDTVIALLESLGAMVDSAVTSGTDFLLFGNLPSSKKVSAAIANSVAMINERQFAEMLEQNR